MSVDVEKVLRYESGEMSDEEIIQFFQGLIDSGVVWKLQGNYGRMASYLINEEYCYASDSR